MLKNKLMIKNQIKKQLKQDIVKYRMKIQPINYL